jgi:uncharacterized protein (TIGR04255 family)
MLWNEYRDRYPLVEQQPPLVPIREQFDVAAPRFGFTMQSFPMPRVWFLSEDGHRLVQVQHDLFILNWRKLDTPEDYPHYREIRQRFVDAIGLFEEFIENESIGPLKPVQAELTYVNHIDAHEADGSRKPLSRIIRAWTNEGEVSQSPKTGKFVASGLPEFEEASITTHYIMRGDDGKPMGRLHISVEPQRYVKGNAPLYAVSLVARGAPRSPDIGAAVAVLDESHKAIVNGFTSITTKEMHSVWERTQ